MSAHSQGSDAENSRMDTARPSDVVASIASVSRSPRPELVLRKQKLRDEISRQREEKMDSTGDATRTARLLTLLSNDLPLHRNNADQPEDWAVACYTSVPGEPDTWAFIDRLHNLGVPILLPVLRREPDWAWYAGRQALRPSWRGILEPTTKRLGADALGIARIIVLPALAATPNGHRLGTGGGWYDRALIHASATARTYVLLNDAEVLDEVPVDKWDLPIDVIVTQTRAIATTWGVTRK